MSLMYPEPTPSLFHDDSEPGPLGVAAVALRAAGQMLLQPLRALHQGRIAALEASAPDTHELGDLSENVAEIATALTGGPDAVEADPAQLTLDLPAPKIA